MRLEDYTKLSDKQIANRRKKHRNMVKFGAELEFYSKYDVDSSDDILSSEGYKLWDTVPDHSLYPFMDYEDDGKVNLTIETYNEDPILFLEMHLPHKLSRLIRYINERLDDSILNSDSTFSDIDTFLSNNLDLLDCVRDNFSSVVREFISNNRNTFTRYGVEVRNSLPVTLRSRETVLKQLNDIANHNDLRPRFDNPESGSSDVPPEMRGENHGLVGLHVHFGINKQVQHSVLDLLRLIKFAVENENKIESLAKRPHNRWCRKMTPLFNYINKYLVLLSGSNNYVEYESGWFTTHERFVFDASKYYGVNATNIGLYNVKKERKINTVEFRWGASSVTKNMDDLNAYFDFLEDMYLSCITGDSTLIWYNELNGHTYKFTDISAGYHPTFSKNLCSVVDLDTNKCIGRFSMGDLCTSFHTGIPNEIEEVKDLKLNRLKLDCAMKYKIKEIYETKKNERQLVKKLLKANNTKDHFTFVNTLRKSDNKVKIRKDYGISKQIENTSIMLDPDFYSLQNDDVLSTVTELESW